VMVSAEWNADLKTPYVGSAGEQASAVVRDRSGKVTVRLAATALQNAALEAVSALDRIAGNVPGPMMCRDQSGFSWHECDDAYLLKRPKRDYSDVVTELEWVFYCPELRGFNGGNP